MLNLNDLAGSGGRTDVLVRAVNAALFVSHGIRTDSHVTLHLMGGPGPPRRVLFDGSALRGVRPDERSIAGHIKALLNSPVPPVGRFVEVSTGISHSGGDLQQTLVEWQNEGVGRFVLDAAGGHLSTIPSTGPMGFILSDDCPFTEEESDMIGGLPRVSLGKGWLQGHACITIVHYLLDQSLDRCSPQE
jgi:tRNA (pseudouridine54-N1)-methyltransferase